MKVYKRSVEGMQIHPQYSFVDRKDRQYYTLAFDKEWKFFRSKWAWQDTWTGQCSREVSMLEVLVVTGWSEAQIEKGSIE